MPAAPAAPAVGGPPVGLGGPGNLAALNKKASASTEWMVGGWIRMENPGVFFLVQWNIYELWSILMVYNHRG